VQCDTPCLLWANSGHCAIHSMKQRAKKKCRF
jgi:hypothetical protein